MTTTLDIHLASTVQVEILAWSKRLKSQLNSGCVISVAVGNPICLMTELSFLCMEAENIYLLRPNLEPIIKIPPRSTTLLLISFLFHPFIQAKKKA
jgi:hypothetical protein